MKNMKNLNRELTMEELEGVIGGVEPEIDLALDGQFDRLAQQSSIKQQRGNPLLHSGTSYMASACFCLRLIEMGYYIWYDLQVQGGCFLVR